MLRAYLNSGSMEFPKLIVCICSEGGGAYAQVIGIVTMVHTSARVASSVTRRVIGVISASYIGCIGFLSI